MSQRFTLSLPAPQARKHLHTRSIELCGYRRDDGLWDIEARLSDVKTYDLLRSEGGTLKAGLPVHDMAIRVTVDDSFTVREIASSMNSTPYPECVQARDPMQAMVGAKMGPGWRMAIERAVGGTAGCTHLRELLFSMATAAYQTIPGYRAHMRKLADIPARDDGKPPYHLGKCMSWDFNGPVVRRIYPQFAGWKPARQADGEG